jgi:hypothetical protein
MKRPPKGAIAPGARNPNDNIDNGASYTGVWGDGSGGSVTHSLRALAMRCGTAFTSYDRAPANPRRPARI